MTSRARAVWVILLSTGLAVVLPVRHGVAAEGGREQKPRLRCTAGALAALEPMPPLEYECREREEDSEKSPERRAALKAYRQALEAAFSDPGWWAVPVDELNVCSVLGEAREMREDERADLDDKRAVYGDQSTRLLIVVDPCVRYSYSTLNGYILQRAGGRVYATQVLNAYYTRLDLAVDVQFARHNGARLIIVETHTADGSMPPTLFTTYAVYAIDPRSHRAVPKKLFKIGGKLTHEFRYPNYLFENEELEKQWKPPEVFRDGRLSPRFWVHTLAPDQEHFVRKRYDWNGKYYAPR